MDASDETAARFLKTTQAKRDVCQVKPQSDWPPVAVVVISRENTNNNSTNRQEYILALEFSGHQWTVGNRIARESAAAEDMLVNLYAQAGQRRAGSIVCMPSREHRSSVTFGVPQ